MLRWAIYAGALWAAYRAGAAAALGTSPVEAILNPLVPVKQLAGAAGPAAQLKVV